MIRVMRSAGFHHTAYMSSHIGWNAYVRTCGPSGGVDTSLSTQPLCRIRGMASEKRFLIGCGLAEQDDGQRTKT